MTRVVAEPAEVDGRAGQGVGNSVAVESRSAGARPSGMELHVTLAQDVPCSAETRHATEFADALTSPAITLGRLGDGLESSWVAHRWSGGRWQQFSH